jgi:hypothetical protein
MIALAAAAKLSGSWSRKQRQCNDHCGDSHYAFPRHLMTFGKRYASLSEKNMPFRGRTCEKNKIPIIQGLTLANYARRTYHVETLISPI